jgi:hypothetical protein
MPDHRINNLIKELAKKIIHTRKLLAYIKELLRLVELEIRNALYGAQYRTPLPALRSSEAQPAV